MRTIQLDLLFTILVALLVFFTGRALTTRSAFLKRFSIPPPVVGGVLVAILLALADGFGGVRISFDMSLRDNLLLMFFTTVGLSADARMLVKGGPKLMTFLVVSIVFIAIQNLVGLGAAFAMDLHPVVGLLGGSVTLTGGHGTGAAYGARFGDTMNIAGAMELTMACATSGLVLGSLLGGPIAQFLVKRYKLSAAPVVRRGARCRGRRAARRDHRAVDDDHALPDPGVPRRRQDDRPRRAGHRIHPARLPVLPAAGRGHPQRRHAVQDVASAPPRSIWLGGVSLSLFLVMALMGMRLIDLASLAGPLLVILALQTVAMAAYAIFVTFRVMGRDYDAAVLAAGHVGFALSSTAAALAIMKTITERGGPSPLAFLIVPMVGAFFIDIANALLIQGYLALPLFGFPQ